MTFWNYIGEFFLFRWLFGKFKKSATEYDANTEGIGASINRDGKHLIDNHNEDIAPIDDAITPVGDNVLDDSDNSEELDDLDIFMRNNRSSLHHGDYDGYYHSSGRHDFQNDWNSGSYSQTYDEFLDEQDDYDMMDDDF